MQFPSQMFQIKFYKAGKETVYFVIGFNIEKTNYYSNFVYLEKTNLLSLSINRIDNKTTCFNLSWYPQ